MVDPHGNGIVHPLSNWLVCMQIEKAIIEEKITPMLKTPGSASQSLKMSGRLDNSSNNRGNEARFLMPQTI
jgi:hypothetical protein